MARDLNKAQQREKAIQHAIASTFTDDDGGRIDILTAALARVIRSRTGRPLANRTAAGYCKKLFDALIGANYV